MSGMILSPLPTGMSTPTEVQFYAARDRSDTPMTLAPAQDSGGTWGVDTGDTQGRYYPTLVGTDANGATVTSNLSLIDLPDDPNMVVSPESVAMKAPNMKLPLSDDIRDVVTGAILDAQADVEAYLGRPLTPQQYVEQNRYAYPNGWNLVDAPDEPLVKVLSAVAQLDPSSGQPTDYFTVTYLAGIDAKHDAQLHPIRRYVTAHAVNSPEFMHMWIQVTNAKGIVRSISAEGQSINWEAPSLGGTETTMNRGKNMAAPGTTPGSLPTIASLDRWRLAGRRVHQGQSRGGLGWPYDYDPLTPVYFDENRLTDWWW